MKALKKPVALFLCMVMVLSLMAVSVTAVSADSHAVIHSYSSNGVSKYGYRNIDYSAESVYSGASPKLRKGNDLPSSFDSRTNDCISGVKEQGDYGTCWTFGAMCAAESSLVLNNGYDIDDMDLAELHLAYYGYNYA